jgi:lipoate-protein ligase A
LSAGGAWEVERTEGPAGPQHARPVPEPARRLVWVHRVLRPALVLGSGQAAEDVDLGAATAAGVEVAQRRSGGGAVLLRPGRSLWVDLVVPAGDPRWSDDVVRAASWVGEAWAVALQQQGVVAEVHHGRLDAGVWGRRVCFAGIGPGEVVVDGRKVVGLSQRRTRAGARFQCVADPTWQAAGVLDLLALEPDERARAGVELAPPGGWQAPPIDLDRLEADLLDLLPG